MSSPPLATVRNGYLSASLPDDMHSPAARRRSTSLSPSERSSRSRITVVDNDPELASYHAPETHSSYKTTKLYAPRYTWFEHLLGLFGVNVAKRKEPIVREEILASKATESDETEDDPSPWVLPVYVLSSRKDTDKQHVPTVAKCTIDTGNQQGNIVSRHFVVNVLQFPEANFRPLTEKEKKGATGITGHRFIPEAAIYLTWYHKKSTRVFRDMRFLISPNQHFDLIIGSHSIRVHNLLDVPNLMANNDGHLGRTAVERKPKDSEREKLNNKVYKADEQVNSLEIRKADEEDTTYIKDVERKLVNARNALAAAKKELAEYDAKPEADVDASTLQQKASTGSTGIDSQTKPKKRLFRSSAK